MSPAFSVGPGDFNCTIYVASPSDQDVLVWSFDRLEVVKGSVTVWSGDTRKHTNMLAQYIGPFFIKQVPILQRNIITKRSSID